MSYIVWTDGGVEGWGRSEDLATLDDVLAYVASDQCFREPLITQKVDVRLVERTYTPVDVTEPPKTCVCVSASGLARIGCPIHDPRRGVKE